MSEIVRMSGAWTERESLPAAHRGRLAANAAYLETINIRDNAALMVIRAEPTR